jgi:hypothetical protein
LPGNAQKEGIPFSILNASYLGNEAGLTAAKGVAIRKINEVVQVYEKRATFSLDEFETTLEARSLRLGKGEWPVEWRAFKEGERNGISGHWVAIISLDDPTSDSTTNGPRSPHVGYEIGFVKHGRGGDDRILGGHIFVPHGLIDACRPHRDARSYFERRMKVPSKVTPWGKK